MIFFGQPQVLEHTQGAIFPHMPLEALCSFAIVGWSAQPGRTPIEYTSLAFLALVTITGCICGFAMDSKRRLLANSGQGVT